MTFEKFAALRIGDPYEHDGKTSYVSYHDREIFFVISDRKRWEIVTIVVEPTRALALKGVWSTPLEYPGTDRVFSHARPLQEEDNKVGDLKEILKLAVTLSKEYPNLQVQVYEWTDHHYLIRFENQALIQLDGEPVRLYATVRKGMITLATEENTEKKENQ